MPAPQSVTVIIVISKHRLDLSDLRKPAHVKVIVIAPPRLLYDEANVDVYYQVEPPMEDIEKCQLLQKVREICTLHHNTQRRLVTFERKLQLSLAKLRFEYDIEGYKPDELDYLQSIRDTSMFSRRGGLSTVKHCSLAGQPEPEQWIEVAKCHVGKFPVIIRPSRSLGNPTHSMSIARTEDELRSWIRKRLSTGRVEEEYFIEECLEDGHEFLAICDSRGLKGCISSFESHRSVYECIKDHLPYSLEFFSVDQTRDLLPGLESFIMQTIKTISLKSTAGIFFIKGFYKDHKDIYFLSLSLEPESDSHRTLIAFPRHTPNWEVLHVESLIDDGPNGPSPDPPSVAEYHAMINFPSTEGVLLHQTSVLKNRTSKLRVCWRAAESQEMRDAEGFDENVLQIYITNKVRNLLHQDVADILATTDIPIDKGPIEQRQEIYRRNLARLSGQKELIRSCTTSD